MDKILQKVMKNPQRQKRGKKSTKTYMKMLKEDILWNNQLSTSFSTNNSTPSTSSSTENSAPSTYSFTDKSTPSTLPSADNSTPSTLSSTDNSTPSTLSFTDNSTSSTPSCTNNVTTRSYIYGVGIAAFLAIGVCIFFEYNKKSFQVVH